MTNKKALVYYIFLNILISALTTLSVLWIWDRLQLSAGKYSPPIETVVATEPAPLPSMGQTVIKIDNVFGMANLQNEMVLFRRLGDGELWLTGWQMKDSHGHVYTFPRLLLNKDGAVQVYTRTGTDTAITLFWGLPQAVWNSGDTVVLYDSQGSLRTEFKIP
jgi:hypothetical protein